MTHLRDHGGALDAAIARHGGQRSDWTDLSTGINPVPYPVPDLQARAWTDLPDSEAEHELATTARRFWRVPRGAGLLAVPGVSAAIARIPSLLSPGRVRIDAPTYNEYAAAFTSAGWEVGRTQPGARVIVHPDNPTGVFRDNPEQPGNGSELCVIDESFCDPTPDLTHIAMADSPGMLVLKSIGKFWGLAGLRLGFVMGDPVLLERLRESLGPWPVSGPALEIGTRALADSRWARETRIRLRKDALRLDTLMTGRGAARVGGTCLFRLYDVDNAAEWRDRLSQRRVLTRTFPYSRTWIRLGLPAPDRWQELEAAL